MDHVTSKPVQNKKEIKKNQSSLLLTFSHSDKPSWRHGGPGLVYDTLPTNEQALNNIKQQKHPNLL